MSALEEALDVLKDVATGGARQRAVALARGARLLSELSADEKRELAVRVAEKAAPHLVPVIEAETGMDLSPQQISAVLDMARQLDEDQVAELRASLLDEGHRSDLAAGVLSGLAADLGLEVPDDLSELDPDPDLVVEDDHLPVSPPSATPAPVDLLAPDPADVEDHEPHELDLDPLPASPLPTDVPDDASLDAIADGPVVATAEDGPEAPTPTAPVVAAFPSSAEAPEDSPDAPAEPVEEPVASLDPRTILDALGSARSPRARRTVLNDTSTDDLWRIGPDARRQVVQAFPDGWQRRRALHRLLDVDVVTADEAAALARTVEDTASRGWVVGSLSAAGLLDREDLDGLVSGPAADRIGARRGG